MNYNKMIMDYAQQFTEETKAKFLVSIKQLKEQYHRSNEWIYTALSNKEPAVWEEHGFGLMFKPNYIYHIDHKLAVNSMKFNVVSQGNFTSSLSSLLED